MTHPAHIAATPIFRWRGARPFLLDLQPDDTGSAILLALSRQGECCLLPVAWEQNLPSLPLHSPLTFHENALDQEAFHLTLSDLLTDGWQISGRIDIRFTGQYTIPNFWQTIQTNLWHDSTPDQQ